MADTWRGGQLFGCHCDCRNDHPNISIRCGGDAVTTRRLGRIEDGPGINAAMCANCAGAHDQYQIKHTELISATD